MKRFSDSLKLLFWAYVLLAASHLINLVFFTDKLDTLLTLPATCLELAALYQMRTLSERFRKAFRLNIIQLIGLAAMFVFLVATLILADASSAVRTIVGLTLVLLIALMIVSLVAEYQLFQGLEEMRFSLVPSYPHGLDVCFYIRLVSAVIAGLLGALFDIVDFIEPLAGCLLTGYVAYVIWGFWHAVQEAEETQENTAQQAE